MRWSKELEFCVNDPTSPFVLTLFATLLASDCRIASITVGSVLVFCELTAICWLILQEDFEGGVAKVREGISATLGVGESTLKLDDCWERYVKWKESWLVERAEGAATDEASLTKFEISAEGEEQGQGQGQGHSYRGNADVMLPTTAKQKRFLKNSRILDERMLKQVSRAFPHYVQRREIMKIYDSQTHCQGEGEMLKALVTFVSPSLTPFYPTHPPLIPEDEGLSNFYHAADGHSYTLLLLRDETDKIFGAFADEQWKDKGGSFYGGKDCFIFEWDVAGNFVVHTHKKAKAGSQKRAGNLFMIGSQDFLGMGSGEGGTFALYLDQDLSMGSSSPSIIFGNTKPISGLEEFVVENMEVWAFDI